MKLELDLQPIDRKRINYIAPPWWIVMLLFLFTIGHFFYIKNQNFKIKNSINTVLAKKIKEFQKLQERKNKLLSLKQKVERLENEVSDLKNRIMRQRLSWYTLFSILESAIPDNLYLTLLNSDEKNIRDFVLEGEAKTMSDIVLFMANLLKSDYFSNVVIVESKQITVETYNKPIFRFRITCHFLG